MKLYSSLLTSWSLQGKRVLVRADLNVPMENSTIKNDFRLRAILPTLDLILQKEGKVILVTHRAKPTQPTSELSTKLLIPWFEQRGYRIGFCPEIPTVQDLAAFNHCQIIMLENIRFFPGERLHDRSFAQSLAMIADYYVAEGFGVLHRNDTSVALLPTLYAPERKTIGLAVARDLTMLYPIRTNPPRPFCLIIGGAKIADKLELVKELVPKLDTILLCPALCFTITKTLGLPIGNSLVDNNAENLVKELLTEVDKYSVKLIVPSDYQVARQTRDGELFIVPANAFPEDAIGMSIGPVTSTLFANEIARANTILFNGTPGFYDKPDTLKGTKTLLEAMQQSKGISIVAGGDSIAITEQLEMTGNITHLASGGGATLKYLSGQALPGLIALGIVD